MALKPLRGEKHRAGSPPAASRSLWEAALRLRSGKEGDTFEKEKGMGGISILSDYHRGYGGYDIYQLFYCQRSVFYLFAALTLVSGGVVLIHCDPIPLLRSDRAPQRVQIL